MARDTKAQDKHLAAEPEPVFAVRHEHDGIPYRPGDGAGHLDADSQAWMRKAGIITGPLQTDSQPVQPALTESQPAPGGETTDETQR